MATRQDTAAMRPRTRRSLAHVPRSRMTSNLDKENATNDIATTSETTTRSSAKKKSLAARVSDQGVSTLFNILMSTASFPLRSILKPTIPVSPVRNIPSFEETRRRTPRDASNNATKGDDNEEGRDNPLIDFSTPAQPADSMREQLNTPFDTFNATSLIRDELAATKERDEKERQERERQTILEKREARRKSMANRRVSFAPEATLHTWNVVEIPEDATSSSTSNSTRRNSTAAKQIDQTNSAPQSAEQNSSPAYAESDLGFSPVREQELQQMRDNSLSNEEEDVAPALSSSPFSGSSAVSDDASTHSDVDDDEDGDSAESEDGFEAESTAMSMDDMTVRSSASAQSNASSSSSSSARLNEALRRAAREAGTKEVEETGEVSMEIVDQEITGAFQPWIKKGQRQSFDWDDLSARHDEDIPDSNKPATEIDTAPSDDTMDDDLNEELSMDVTNVVGGILGRPSARRPSAVSRKSFGQETNYGDETMEMTTMVGGIANDQSHAQQSFVDDENEEMTMEFTSVVGGVLSKDQLPHAQETDLLPDSKLTTVDRNSQSDEDSEIEMDMTNAVGGILPSGLETPDKAKAKRIMELEAESGQLGSSPFEPSSQQTPAPLAADSSPVLQVATIASESGSPSLASVRARRSSRRSSLMGASKTPEPNPHQPSQLERPATPPQAPTPPARPTTPSKTPPSANIAYRSASPRKLFKPELKHSFASKQSPRPSIFEQDVSTGHSTPRIVLQPREGRRSSGVGIDKEGLGSPRVAAILDNRLSLGENTPQFIPQERTRTGGVRFEDPLKIQEEEERERRQEQDGNALLRDNMTNDPTSNLKELISRMTPKKGVKVGPRKSLHVGAARGLLGKRPAELDFDEDESDNSPKRLRGHSVSPVKGIRLPAPSHQGPIDRVAQSPVRRARSSSPLKGSTTPMHEPTVDNDDGTTPLKKGIDAMHLASDPPAPEQDQSREDDDAEDQDEAENPEPIQLQDFLNMTNIHFMELTTTKRRHTTAPGSASKRLSRASLESKAKQGTITFDDRVAAGFCTVPMLELYQHSCRELKSYISEGRQVIRSIESETFADNPPLFREYINAPPDIRVIMDNQFRNVKTHARLLSKATWYEWRMKLLEGLKEGLHRHVKDMKADDELLSKREALLDSSVPPLVEKHASLQEEAQNLQQRIEEMESCDQNELQDARETLSSVEEEIAAKKKELEDLQAEVQEKSQIIEVGIETRNEYLAQIQEAERVKEECRGWSARDIRELRASVQKLEQQTGWSIPPAAASAKSSPEPRLSMVYQRQLNVTFCPRALTVTSGATSPLELNFIPAKTTSPVATLVLQSLRRHLGATELSTITPKQLLKFVSSAWDRAVSLEQEARMLEFCGLTRLTLSEPTESSPFLRARCTLLDQEAKPSAPRRKSGAGREVTPKRVDVDFTIRTRIDTQTKETGSIGTLELDINVVATKVYGFGAANESGLSGKEMQSILNKGISGESEKSLGNGMWFKAVQSLTDSVF
ncbi:hypothetical protein N7539_001535 [Penicillium diatomitis]|uniref:Spc7 kinetochore protein domain-containing protein n=1 Tax=Penicillium diatomitis TaxID=2819901 RepID=A0A9X0C0B1_9EURO|nr:uncharacterized protein N7539_001535 [Penicillium diatomitis]KAJ5492789.1 hypothetical protein N7539_001535 [Penicillium diatomitis]